MTHEQEALKELLDAAKGIIPEIWLLKDGPGSGKALQRLRWAIQKVEELNNENYH